MDLSQSKFILEVDLSRRVLYLEVDCISNNEGINSSDDGAISSLGLDSADDDRSINMKMSSKSANQKRVEEFFVGLENMSQYIPCLLTILRREQQRDNQNYKILVFFPAGRLVRFLFQFFTFCLPNGGGEAGCQFSCDC